MCTSYLNWCFAKECATERICKLYKSCARKSILEVRTYSGWNVGFWFFIYSVQVSRQWAWVYLASDRETHTVDLNSSFLTVPRCGQWIRVRWHISPGHIVYSNRTLGMDDLFVEVHKRRVEKFLELDSGRLGRRGSGTVFGIKQLFTGKNQFYWVLDSYFSSVAIKCNLESIFYRKYAIFGINN